MPQAQTLDTVSALKVSVDTLRKEVRRRFIAILVILALGGSLFMLNYNISKDNNQILRIAQDVSGPEFARRRSIEFACLTIIAHDALDDHDPIKIPTHCAKIQKVLMEEGIIP